MRQDNPQHYRSNFSHTNNISKKWTILVQVFRVLFTPSTGFSKSVWTKIKCVGKILCLLKMISTSCHGNSQSVIFKNIKFWGKIYIEILALKAIPLDKFLISLHISVLLKLFKNFHSTVQWIQKSDTSEKNI